MSLEQLGPQQPQAQPACNPTSVNANVGNGYRDGTGTGQAHIKKSVQRHDPRRAHQPLGDWGIFGTAKPRGLCTVLADDLQGADAPVAHRDIEPAQGIGSDGKGLLLGLGPEADLLVSILSADKAQPRHIIRPPLQAF